MFRWLFRRAHCRPFTDLTPSGDSQLMRPEMQFHLKEYEALRAEQRTRLDSANKIIHYSALITAAFIGGMVTAYGRVPIDVLRVLLLLMPAVLMPFALTQQNEEIMVRKIGEYFDRLRERIDPAGQYVFWEWERDHNSDERPATLITGFFRSGLLLILSALGLCIYVGVWGWPVTILRRTLFTVDTALVALGTSVAIAMVRRRRQAIKRAKAAVRPE